MFLCAGGGGGRAMGGGAKKPPAFFKRSIPLQWLVSQKLKLVKSPRLQACPGCRALTAAAHRSPVATVAPRVG